jgi:hypothetical protein
MLHRLACSQKQQQHLYDCRPRRAAAPALVGRSFDMPSAKLLFTTRVARWSSPALPGAATTFSVAAALLVGVGGRASLRLADAALRSVRGKVRVAALTGDARFCTPPFCGLLSLADGLPASGLDMLLLRVFLAGESADETAVGCCACTSTGGAAA